jgi:hypothetical protein
VVRKEEMPMRITYDPTATLTKRARVVQTYDRPKVVVGEDGRHRMVESTKKPLEDPACTFDVNGNMICTVPWNFPVWSEENWVYPLGSGPSAAERAEALKAEETAATLPVKEVVLSREVQAIADAVTPVKRGKATASMDVQNTKRWAEYQREQVRRQDEQRERERIQRQQADAAIDAAARANAARPVTPPTEAEVYSLLPKKLEFEPAATPQQKLLAARQIQDSLAIEMKKLQDALAQMQTLMDEANNVITIAKDAITKEQEDARLAAVAAEEAKKKRIEDGLKAAAMVAQEKKKVVEEEQKMKAARKAEEDQRMQAALFAIYNVPAQFGINLYQDELVKGSSPDQIQQVMVDWFSEVVKNNPEYNPDTLWAWVVAGIDQVVTAEKNVLR